MKNVLLSITILLTPFLVKSQNCEQPTICDRICWSANNQHPAHPNQTPTQVTHIIVHHSAGNFPASTDFKQVVQSYWDLHVNTNGWDDIGYNWLVDMNGIIYEGRGDGNKGAHFSCMNAQTMGICMIGNFETATPTAESITALEKMIVWEASDKGINLADSSIHTNSQLLLHPVVGHRDGNASTAAASCASGTVCPGENLYALLPTIRTASNAYPCYADSASINAIEHTTLNDNSLSIYPNPSSELVTIVLPLKAFSLVIYNSFGKLERSFTQLTGFTDKLIDISSLANGLYLCKVITKEGEVFSGKITKK